jgi:hypothetical protein
MDTTGLPEDLKWSDYVKILAQMHHIKTDFKRNRIGGGGLNTPGSCENANQPGMFKSPFFLKQASAAHRWCI